ncbi:unnamed protein product [Staurois parvus]|uniref:Uncharacterized protein n=1 Tax=Staurois parvus TaxID=386267 RepID=A0ABN9EGB0_9NEOB|nr:unnamed protein product [Staurois parvus]
MFDSVFSDPPLLLLSPIHLLIEQSLKGKVRMLSFLGVFFGRVHVISTGPIKLSRQSVRGYAAS